jgi:hypothetical protein
MTDDQIRQLADMYDVQCAMMSHCEPKKIDPKEVGFTDNMDDFDKVFAHLRWCCGQIKRYLDQGHPLEARQWLGFVQGCLWMRGVFSLEEMRAHGVLE